MEANVLPEPSISVIIPNWNRASLLSRCISSAVYQSMPPVEVLVCDDGSSDDSKGIVESLNLENVRWLDGPRSSLPAVPRNSGIRAAVGEWIAFLDSDDYWFREKLELQYGVAIDLDVKAVCSNALKYVDPIGLDGNLLACEGKQLGFLDLLKVNNVVTSSALIHRSIFEKIGGFPEEPRLRALEDYAFWLRVSTYTDFGYVSEPLLAYTYNNHESVRKFGARNEFDQRRRVLKSFLAWSRNQQIKRIFDDAVKDELRRGSVMDWVGLARSRLHSIARRMMLQK